MRTMPVAGGVTARPVARPGARRAAGSGLALLATCVVLLLAACSGDEAPPTPDRRGATQQTRPSTAPVTVSYAFPQQFSSYNNNTAEQASSRNAVVLSQVLRGFWSIGPDGALVPDKEFGTVERMKDSSGLTLTYRFEDKAVWSDGEPIDCDDAVLAWAANSGRWPTGRTDPLSGRKITAFSAASIVGWQDADRPACKDGEREFTLHYDAPYADWQSLFRAGTILPAHVLEKESGVKDLIAAIREGDRSAIRKLGEIYNSLWLFRPGQYRTAVAPSAGPYQVAAWKAEQSITMEPNPRWWGAPPRAGTVVIRFLAVDRQAEALKDGTIQVMDPPADAELLARLKGLGSGVTVSTHDGFTWEHLDLNRNAVFSDRRVREAFATCLPRQRIVDNLVKPQNPDAQVLQSRFVMPFQPGYAALAATGGQEYLSGDVARAKSLLRTAGRASVTVRIGYPQPDPRRKAEFDLIRDFCGRAGFRIKDAGSPTFFSAELPRRNYDAALFAWSGSALVTQTAETFSGDGRRNYRGYRNPEVDALIRRLGRELDPDRQRDLQADLDRLLWADLDTIPLFAYPTVVAVAAGVEGVRFTPGPAGVAENLQEWMAGSTGQPSAGPSRAPTP
jgi:peptide/nickel transport system substrate-binding protein